MSQITNLIDTFSDVQHKEVLALLEKSKNVSISGLPNFSAKSFVAAEVLENASDVETVLWIVNDAKEQEVLLKTLHFWTDVDVFGYHLEEVTPVVSAAAVERFNHLSKLELISRIQAPTKKIIVASYLDLIEEVPSSRDVKEGIFDLAKGDEISAVELIENLLQMDYELSEDTYLEKGTYLKSGDTISVFPVNYERPLRIDLDFDTVAEIIEYDLEDESYSSVFQKVSLYSTKWLDEKVSAMSYLNGNALVLEDEIDVVDEFYNEWNALMDSTFEKVRSISVSSFNEATANHAHLHFMSMLTFRSSYDLMNDIRAKHQDGWRVVIFTKNKSEFEGIFKENRLPFSTDFHRFDKGKADVCVIEVDKDDVFPGAFQHQDLKFAVFSDREVSNVREEKKKNFNQKVYLDFLTGLKKDDYVVHSDHGIAVFMGLEKRTIDKVTREYLKLGYAENDKLYVPIDQADKVNKYIGAADHMPKLTRLGSAEWSTLTKKVKKETQIIAKELLELYAQRKSARGFKYKNDLTDQEKFEATFPYEETPGQIKAINDVKADMEREMPMDRLVCGDVGFGKTEVAMRAAFKAVQDKKQVVVISPITILTDQHYRSFSKRMNPFNVRVDVLSRFRTPAEQKKVLKKLADGEIDIVIGTHRLLQPDVKFKNLGLLIVDEEQRFGVKQKEHIKGMRAEVDVLTLTATPIPRTLNICLNKLRDISIINTPPPGRLPVVTEVRRFSNGLIREAIMREIERGGQVYFLHNRVQTINSMADKLRALVPEAKFGVAHGKLGSGDLEERIVAFKEHKFDVLVSSTIIENGIDLANANTLIVNNAEKFGLSQLYQLRGRVGRGKAQAFAYFLYQGQRLKLDAKKRLRAIVEASELGSGFQIAMKDLEIRGVGDILGANQHGVVNVVGVSHFIRMLNKAVEDLQSGRTVKEGEEEPEVAIELPLPAFIPDAYIVNSKEKINVYQRLASADKMDYLRELQEDVMENFGKMPKEVMNLFRVLELKIEAKKAGLLRVKAENLHMKDKKQIVMTMSDKMKPANIMNLLEFNPGWQITGTKLVIALDELGLNWFDTLKENVKKLQKKVTDKR